jgi:trigger factor
MPEIDEAVVGLGPGGTRSTRVRFADDHRNEALRGKSGAAEVKVNEVKEKVLPPLNDDFARTVGAFETLDALREEVRKGLMNRREHDNRRALDQAVVESVLAEHPFDVPDALVRRQAGLQIEHMRETMRRQGVDPDRLPWDYQKLYAELRPGAERAVKRALVIEAIGEREGLTPSEADVDAEVDRIAESSQRPVAAVRAMLERDGDLERIKDSLMERRALDFLIERATITG